MMYTVHYHFSKISLECQQFGSDQRKFGRDTTLMYLILNFHFEIDKQIIYVSVEKYQPDPITDGFSYRCRRYRYKLFLTPMTAKPLSLFQDAV